MNCAATDRCVYRMSCYDKSKANVLTESINEVSDATGMTAAPLTDEDLEIQGLWDEVFSRGCEIVARHHEKLSEVSQDLDKIDSESKSRKTVKDKKRLIDLEEYDRRMGRKKPLISKLKELQSQEVEFNKYMDRLQLQIIDLKGNANLKRAVETLRTEFKLELDRFTSALPMYARKTAIVDTVRNNRVSIILGETGSGKSTQILQYLHEAGFTNEGLVVCTQPRKVAAVSLASRVAQEMGCKVGQLVGYQVGMQVKRSAETKLLYVTDHILLNDCLKDPLFSQYSCLVIDEAHERSIYTDLLLGFIKRSLVGRNDLKVIITSATIDPDIFIRYFDGSPHVVKVSGRAFPVDVIYEEVNCEEDYVEVAVNKSLWVHKTRGPGDVLVFLTSPIETEKACNMLKKYAQQSVIALELNGRLQLEEQQKVFDSTPSEKRKIVFATNSAETSVTIPGIKYVIDTGRIREMNYDAKRNMSVLGLTWTTKSSADQRKGRAGRTDSGYCYRLYTQDTYESMRPNSVPEILRVHLGQAMLKLLMLGIDDPMKFQFVESPKREDIEEALSVLEELGAYDISVGITEIGKKLSLIAVEPRLGKAALRGIEEGVGYEAMVIAAVCSAGGSVFFRAGSAEAKQASDRSKLRFCDEWGDMITGAMIFKEWDQLPTQDRGGWCKVNNINGKTMKFAKDSLKEIMQTFKQDLKLTVAKKFSDDPEVNEVLAKILLECYPSQLARFLGHERIGYCLANDPKQSLHLHPSSSLLYMETPPTWVIYQQILSTTNINKTDIFMTNVTFVDESWIDERLSDGKLKINVDEVLEEVINPEIFAGLGKQCIFRLLDKKGQALRDLEDGITKESSSCEKPRLSIQLDTKRKSIVVYADRHIKQLAKAKVQSFLDEVRHSLRDETIEQPIRKGSNVRFVLGGGLQIKSILMPGEQRQLAIFCSQTQSCRMERVCEVLREYGEIESYTLNSQPNSPVFGYVTFKNAKDAKAAAKDRSMQSGFRVEMSLKDAAAFKSRSANFSMKVEVSRRPLTGFGYVQLHSDEVVNIVLRKNNCLKINKQLGQSRTVEATIKISSNPRNYDQICLKHIPEWATPYIVKSALQEVIGSLSPGQDLINVVLLRKPPPPPDDSQRLYQLFRGLITQKLISSGEFSTRDFEVQTNEPKDKDFTMSAYLRFEDPDKAVRAAELLDGVGFGSQDIEARLDLKTSFVVPAYVYGNCKQHVEDEIKRLNRSSAGVVNVIMDRRKNGSYLIKVETSELEDLKEARAKLDLLLSGHRLDIDSSKYALLKSEAAMRKRDEIEKKARVSIRLDNRQEALFIYGQRESIERASRLLNEYLSQTKSSVSKEISLRDGGYPIGIMKTLVGQYGSNLEKLKSMCCAFNLELNLKRHVIRFHGTHESYEHLKALIEESAAQIPGPRIEPEPAPDCSVCLTSIDYDDCYALEFCGHYYCSECAKDVVRNGLSNKTIPIRCVLEDCGKDLVLKDFQNLLPRIEEAFDPAIKSFMATCDKEFAYCPTPDCPMIYRKGKKVGEEFACSECNASICTKCDNAFHAGMTCETYCSFFVKADNEIKIWLLGDPVRRALCPKCGVGIEKNEGCNHVECKSCKAHICWNCKKHFSDSGACYQHLSEKHGGYA